MDEIDDFDFLNLIDSKSSIIMKEEDKYQENNETINGNCDEKENKFENEDGNEKDTKRSLTENISNQMLGLHDQSMKSKRRSATYTPESMSNLAMCKNHGGGRGMTIEERKECTFRPSRSLEATRAMNNTACGYDFVDR